MWEEKSISYIQVRISIFDGYRIFDICRGLENVNGWE